MSRIDLDVHLPAIVLRDSHAFGQWMAGAEGTLRESLRSFAASVDVEAVLQEALLRVWQVAPRFVPDGSPNGLLRLGLRIARNLAISEVRRTRARPVADEHLEEALAAAADDGPAPPDPMLREVLALCFERLAGKPREAMEKRVSSGGRISDDQLASSLQMTLNTFLQNFGRARKALAECLTKHGVAVDQELSA
jgi:DNA-directed RNA polymerase specialized sigma24 family protein